MYNRWSKLRACDAVDFTSSHTNDRYFNTPKKKARLDELRKHVQAANRYKLLQEIKIESLPETRGFVSLIIDEMKVKEGLK